MARVNASVAAAEVAGRAQADAKAAAAPAKPAAAPDAKIETKAEPAKVETSDPATERGLRAVEQAKKKWQDEQASAKAELEVQRAEIARLRKDAEGKVGSIEELKKLRAIEILDRLDLSEDDYDEVARASYARTKAGKVDPRAQSAAQEAARSSKTRAEASSVSEMKAEIEALRAELRGEFNRRDMAQHAERWVGEGLKAVPSDKPSWFAKLIATEPETARLELRSIGAELEKANDGETPTHAEVIAEFETRKRAQLKALGLDPDALLAPAPAAKPAPRTLDPAARTITRPENAPTTRDEKRANAIANLRARQRTTADAT